MNKITYGMIKEEYRCDQSNRVSYGIAAYENFEEDGMASDRERDDYLAALGIQVLRYSNADIDRRFNGVCEDILRHL